MSKIVGVLIVSTLLLVVAAPAGADVRAGCSVCGILGCTGADSGTFGNTQCESHFQGSLGSSGLNATIVCNPGGEICSAQKVDVFVYGQSDVPCDFWEWLFFGC